MKGVIGNSCNIINFPAATSGHFLGCLLCLLQYDRPFVVHPIIGHCHINADSYPPIYNTTGFHNRGIGKVIKRFAIGINDVCIVGHPPDAMNDIKHVLGKLKRKFKTLNIINVDINQEDYSKVAVLQQMKTFRKYNTPIHPPKNYMEMDFIFEHRIQTHISHYQNLDDFKKTKHLVNIQKYNELKLEDEIFIDIHHDYAKSSYMKVIKNQVNEILKSQTNVNYYNIQFKDIYINPNKILNLVSEIAEKERTQEVRNKYAEYLWVNKRTWNRYIPYASFWTGKIKKSYEHL